IVSPARRFASPGARDEVDGLGGVARVDHFAHAAGVNELGDLLAGALVGGGGLLAECVDPAMYVGVARRGELGHRLQHLPGLLRGGRAVEEDERLAVDLARQDGKILAPRQCLDLAAALRVSSPRLDHYNPLSVAVCTVRAVRAVPAHGT